MASNCRICVHLCKDDGGWACGYNGYWFKEIEGMLDNYCEPNDPFIQKEGKEKYYPNYKAKYKKEGWRDFWARELERRREEQEE